MSSSDSSVYFGSDTSSSFSDSDDYMYRFPKTRNEHYIQNTVMAYSNHEFFEHFHISRAVTNSLVEKFGNSRYFSYKVGEFGKISALEYVIIFLWFAGHEAASYRDVSDRFDISLSSLRKIVIKMTYFLSNLSNEMIQWPDLNERVTIERNFRQKGFPGVIGAIDGSHVKIDKPTEDPDSYLNRKHFYSIHVSTFYTYLCKMSLFFNC